MSVQGEGMKKRRMQKDAKGYASEVKNSVMHA